MNLIPKVNCIFYCDYGKCGHLDRGRGFLWLGKSCILNDKFVGSCKRKIEYEKIIPAPPLMKVKI